MGERIGLRWGFWVARAGRGPLAAPTLPRVPNSHCLLAPMPNAVRLHQVPPPPRMCAVFISMHGWLGHRLWAGGGGEQPPLLPPGAATPSLSAAQPQGSHLHVAAGYAVLSRARSLVDRDRSIVAPSRADRPQLPYLAPARAEALYPRQSGRSCSRAARP